MPQIIERSRASPSSQSLTVPYKHTQDFINALLEGLKPQDIKNPILRVMAKAIINQTPNQTYYSACINGLSFRFSFVASDGQNIAPKLSDLSKVLDEIETAVCRNCEQKTLFFEITIPGKNKTRGKVGYLTIECSKVVLDSLEPGDFGLGLGKEE